MSRAASERPANIVEDPELHERRTSPGDMSRQESGAPSIANRKSETNNSCAFLLDLAGQDESSTSSPRLTDGAFEFDSNYSRHTVTLRIVEVDKRGGRHPSPEADRQYAACQSEVLIGPRRTMRWGVPEGLRDENGELIHDDIPLADSLVAELDKLQWTFHTETLIIPAPDPLDDMSRFR